MAPLYLGLVCSILVLLGKFVKEFLHLIPMVINGDSGNVIVGVLSLVDIVMIANLLVLIIFAGYENFVSPIDNDQPKQWPEWMGDIDFSGLKLNLMSSIVAISAIQLLRAFMDLKNATDRDLIWSVGIHLAFVFSALVLALSDKFSDHGPAKGDEH